jgi:3-hydroxyacyl-CoA dehydrogenase
MADLFTPAAEQHFKKVAVIGSGVMGCGIAAQIANAGVRVLLLDIPAKDGANRNAVAEGAVAKALKTDPAPFMSPAAAKLIETGNIDDDLARVAECDWIVEVVVERLDIKQALYRKLDAVRRPGTAISSNTSTIPLATLLDGLPESFARDFMITHFFNPPRYMRLLELVTGPATDAALAEKVGLFCDTAMGKSVVRCKDSPGFIANRLGVFWMTSAVTETTEHGLTIEEADAIMGRPFGVPKTGVFGLMDLVGLDLMPHVNASMAGALPKDDAFHAINRDVPVVPKLIAEGYTGRKGKGGFYRLNKAGGKRVKETVDLATGVFRPEQPAQLPEIAAAGRDLRKLMGAPGKVGAYAWKVMGHTMAYAAKLIPEATDEIVAIDEAMRLGYNWKHGPFELIDMVGADWLIERLRADKFDVPPMLERAAGRTFYRVENGVRQQLGQDGDYHDIVRPDGVLMLEDIKRTATPVLKNGSAAVWDIGDGVLCFEFTSKSNSLDEQIMSLLGKTIAAVKKDYKALVIYNEGGNFSVGANIGLALFAANIAAWMQVESMVATGQDMMQKLKYAPFPVVAAPSGMALGGGCEFLLHSDAVQAHAETYAGLVECGVGLLPGWGGCKEMLGRWATAPKMPKGPMPAPMKVFEMISTAKVAKSAAEAGEMLVLRPTDRVTMNRYRLLADAKKRALELAVDYKAPEPREIVLPGASGKLALDQAVAGFRKTGMATKHDVTVSGELARVLTGGDTDIVDTVKESKILDLERESFLRLLRTPGTLARIEHMLETGKPLRN